MLIIFFAEAQEQLGQFIV